MAENSWTFTTLLAHLKAIIEANDARYKERFAEVDKSLNTAVRTIEHSASVALASSDRALTKAEDSQAKVNEGQNEFRQQLRDQAATFVTRDMHSALEARIQQVEAFGSRHQGVSSIVVVLWSIGTAIVVTVIGAVAAVLVAKM